MTFIYHLTRPNEYEAIQDFLLPLSLQVIFQSMITSVLSIKRCDKYHTDFDLAKLIWITPTLTRDQSSNRLLDYSCNRSSISIASIHQVKTTHSETSSQTGRLTIVFMMPPFENVSCPSMSVRKIGENTKHICMVPFEQMETMQLVTTIQFLVVKCDRV